MKKLLSAASLLVLLFAVGCKKDERRKPQIEVRFDKSEYQPIFIGHDAGQRITSGYDYTYIGGGELNNIICVYNCLHKRKANQASQ